MDVSDFLKQLQTELQTNSTNNIPNNIQNNEPNNEPNYFNNNITDSLFMIYMSLAKISYLPLFKINQFTEENDLNEINNQLIYIQNMLLIYWEQEYVILQMIKNIIDEEVTSVIQNVNCDLNMDLTNKTNIECITNKLTEQTGGALSQQSIKLCLFLYFLIMLSSATNSIESGVKPDVNPNVEYNFQNSNIVMFQPKKESINESKQISVENIINKYDNLYTRLINIANTVIGAPTLNLPNIINEFNDNMYTISKNVETSCLDLVKLANDNHVFENWKTLKDLDKIVEDQTNLEKMTITNDNYYKSDILKNAQDFVASAVSAPLTNDIMSPLTYAANIFGSVKELLNNGYTEQLNEVKTMSNSNTKSNLEKLNQEKNLLYGSKVYCLTGFKMSLNINGSNIRFEGSSIPYETILFFINELNANLKFKIENSKGDETTKKILISIKQRLTILEGITEYLDLFIHHSGNSDIAHMNKIANSKTMSKLKDYLDNFEKDFNKLSSDLKQTYPEDNQNLKIVDEFFNANLEQEHKHLDQQQKFNEQTNDINLKRAEIDYQQKRSETEGYANYIGQIFNNSKILALSGINGVIGLGMGVGTGTLNYVLKETGKEVIYLQYALLGFLINSPLFWTTLATIGLAISINIAGINGTLKGITNGSKSIIMFTSGSLLFIYELIKTPFGYKWKPVNRLPRYTNDTRSSDRGYEPVPDQQWVIWRPENMDVRARQVVANVQEPPLRLRNRATRWAPLIGQKLNDWEAERRRLGLPIGGKLTRKNKKRKTKKLKGKNKRRHTRNKKGGRTKRR